MISPTVRPLVESHVLRLPWKVPMQTAVLLICVVALAFPVLAQNGAGRTQMKSNTIDFGALAKDSASIRNVIVTHRRVMPSRAETTVISGQGTLEAQVSRNVAGMSLGSAPAPTCSAKISVASVSQLMELFAREQFGHLPEIRPRILIGSDGRSWTDHEIVVKVGEVEFRRIYTSGDDIPNELQPPQRFMAVENAIEQLRDDALISASPCHVAVKWPTTK